jgi:hypothetical protein
VVPAANATCVSATTPITITFDEAPDASTVNSTNIVVTGPGGAVIPVTMSINVTTTQVVLTPNSPLPSGTITVTVKNIGDLADVMMAGPYIWSFSTACGGGGGTSGGGGSGSGGSGSTSAYVYVSSQPTSGTLPTQTVAYAADTNGQLTPVSGSPFSLGIGMMAANSAFLIAASNSGSDINTYTIGSNGALTLGPQFDDSQIDSQIASQIASQYQTGASSVTCGMGVDTFDRSGQSLYTEVVCTDGSNNYGRIGSFAFDSSNGTLSYLGDAESGNTANSPALPFLGNDAFAYQVAPRGCSTFVDGGVFSFARGSNGLLNAFPTVINRPPTPSGATPGAGPFGYVNGIAATDTTNHVAFVEDECFFLGGANQPVQLAAYTANSDGSLTTSDTHDTMPSTPINPNVLAMSPSGTLLAVAGSGGLQIFNFNGASPITNFTGVLTTDFIQQMFWDNNNHLYALEPFPAGPGNTSGPGNLHVFTVTDSGATEAPGSPYTIQNPRYLAVSSQGGH